MNDINNAGITTISTSDLSALASGLPALTTTFTYASSCGNQWLQLSPDASYPTPSSYYSIGSYGTYFSACQPNGKSRFSPGIRPNGYIIATMTEYRQEAKTLDRVWAAYCCNDGFTLNDDQLCFSTFSSSSLTVYRPQTITDTITMVHYTTTQVGLTYDASSNTTVVTYGTKIADPIQIFWRAEDLSMFDPLYAAAIASRLKIDLETTSDGVLDVTTTATIRQLPTGVLPALTSSIPGPTSLSNASSVPSSSRLSTATTAGISVGVAIGGLFSMTVLFLLYRRYRRNKTTKATHQDERADASEGADAPESVAVQEERNQVEASELEAQEKLNELPSPVPEVAELDGRSARNDRRIGM